MSSIKRAFDNVKPSASKKPKVSESSTGPGTFMLLGHVEGHTPSTEQSAIEVTTLRTSSNYRLQKDVTQHIINRPNEFLMPRLSALQQSSHLYDEYGSFAPEREDDINFNHDDPSGQNSGNDETVTPSGSTSKGSSQSTVSKPNRMMAALIQWLPKRQKVVDEILRGEGIGGGSLRHCTLCNLACDSIYKCRDCFGNYLYCSDCLLRVHKRLPLHRTLRFNGDYFEKHSLKDAGMRIQVGHDNGDVCVQPVNGPIDFTVVHVNGIHRIAVDYCGCGHSLGTSFRYLQLLRAFWFPATIERPSTAITFECLESFQELSHSSKINTYDFYVSLARLTDNTGREPLDARYHEFSLVTRLWRHVIALKRGGRGHDPLGVDSTKAGSLAVVCPACPNPGRNLPENWRTLPNQWLYTLFLAVDANFRLKQKERNLHDIELAPGWAQYVETNAFFKFLKNYTQEAEVNTCRSQHNALLHATTLNTAGYRASGVGAVVCGRHSYVRPNGVTDLQKGERYVNMDYIVLNTLAHSEVSNVFITYDIACQWSKHFKKRQEHFPAPMRLPKSLVTRYGVPSFHIAGHGESCQSTYSLNLLPHVGHTYGEGIESQWSHMNAIGTSTREQASGMRQENLCDHWNAWNWWKIVSAGPYFKKSLIAALVQYREVHALYIEFTSTFDSKLIMDWEDRIIQWENDSDKPNPYAEPSDAVTLNDVRLQLAEEEAAAMQTGIVPGHEVTASSFLNDGLDLEERQRTLLLRDTLRDHQINSGKATLQERRNSLWTAIECWRRVQDVYMPYAASLRVKPGDTPAEDGAIKQAETLRLCLPSSIPSDLVDSKLAPLCKKEARLRTAQADDALSDIRRIRRTMTGVSIFKRLNVSGSGQKPNTRVRGIYERLGKSCERAVERYRAARNALFSLDPNGDWQNRLKVLEDADVSGPLRDPETEQSEGRYKMSWIWRVQGCNTTVSEDSTEFSENMRVEWSRARARRLRWKEEVELLTEEMRRVVADLEWRAKQWRGSGRLRSSIDNGDLKARDDLQSGLVMYGNKQAVYMHDIAHRCVTDWAPIISSYNISAPWLQEYISANPITKGNGKSKANNDTYDISSLFDALP